VTSLASLTRSGAPDEEEEEEEQEEQEGQEAERLYLL